MAFAENADRPQLHEELEGALPLLALHARSDAGSVSDHVRGHPRRVQLLLQVMEGALPLLVLLASAEAVELQEAGGAPAAEQPETVMNGNERPLSYIILYYRSIIVRLSSGYRPLSFIVVYYRLLSFY